MSGLSIELPAQDSEASMIFTAGQIVNPALAGARGEGLLRLTYRDYYPGVGSGLGSYSVSYDTYLEAVHGGVGLYLTENNLGEILNDLRAGGTYSYHLRAGRDWFVNAGFMASVIYRSYNNSMIVLPDQIDPVLGPVLPSSETLQLQPRLLFDVSVGFLVTYKNLNGGLSLTHLGRPDLTGLGRDDGRLPRRLTIHFNGEFDIKENELTAAPLAGFNYQDGTGWGMAGVEMSYKVLSVNMLMHAGGGSGLYSLQPGLSVDAGRIKFSYQYYFSPGAGNSAMPLTQSNLVTVSAGLNNVDKRGVLKAIKYPKL